MSQKLKTTSQRARREDVASVAGVSSAAVSYVLNKTKRLSPRWNSAFWMRRGCSITDPTASRNLLRAAERIRSPI